jgi:hypothetical protein
LTNIGQQGLKVQHSRVFPRGSAPFAGFVAVLFAIFVAILGPALAGCGSSSGTADGSATGTGGNRDAAVTDVAGATGGHAGTGGAAGATGTTGAAGTTGTGGAAGASALADMGKSCAADTDCTGGLTCLTASSSVIIGSEGPAHGYCSKMCAVDDDCGGVGFCLNVSASTASPVGYCFQGCTFGANAAKCHQRTDVGCLTIDATTTPTTDVCFPVCSQDSDCPAGRKCDVGNSLCSDTAPTGDPLGTHCVSNPDASATTCAGGCLPLGSPAGGTATIASFCSMFCVVGNLDACNWVGAGSSLSSGGAHGVCALSSANAQIGDIGFCSQECDTAANCSDQTDTGLTCDTSNMSTIGHGICSWE